MVSQSSYAFERLLPPDVAVHGSRCPQAIEDAAALKGCLLKVPSDILSALRLYEQLRLPRASRLQGMSEANTIGFHAGRTRSEAARRGQRCHGLVMAAIAWLYEHDAELAGDR